MADFGEKVEFCAGSEPVVRTRREPLALAVLALVENAIQSGDKARLSLHRDDGNWVITIEDEGPRIPPDYFDAVLDPFFRLDEARQRNTKGFGLGIPTAHRLMIRFNGALSFARAATGSLLAQLRVPAA